MNPEFINKSDIQTLSTGQNKLACTIYKALTREIDGNVFFSPFSISAAVAMVHMGTGGNTEDEVRKTFNFPEDKLSIQRAYQDLIADYKQVVPQYELNTANMAYISDGLQVEESFISTLKASFLSTSKLVDFSKSELITQEINDAVEKETKSKIKNIIPDGILTAMTRMVLVNAIYFKGLWMHQFDPKLTEEKPFYVKSDKSINIPMMSSNKSFRVNDIPDLDAKLLAMDYQGERISFVMLLPNQKEGLSDLEQKLENKDLITLDKNIGTRKITVFIPKFKLENMFDLSATLKSMGVKDLFSEARSDLSGISTNEKLVVSNIIHKAFLDVNEEGSEAAAATAITIQLTSFAIPPPPFMADHPFLFYIYDKASETILFMGRYTEPATN